MLARQVAALRRAEACANVSTAPSRSSTRSGAPLYRSGRLAHARHHPPGRPVTRRDTSPAGHGSGPIVGRVGHRGRSGLRAGRHVDPRRRQRALHHHLGRGAHDCCPPGTLSGYQTSPGRHSQLIGASRSRVGEVGVVRTMMYPSSSEVRRAPVVVRTKEGPRQVCQPSRS